MHSTFASGEYADMSDVKPDCPSCYKRASVSLIDVAVDNGETTPVWHCAHCCKVFGTRTFKVDSILSNSFYSNDYSMALSNISNLQSEMTVIKCDINILTDRLAVLEDSILKLHKKMEEDSLTCLRGRVDGFSLFNDK